MFDPKSYKNKNTGHKLTLALNLLKEELTADKIQFEVTNLLGIDGIPCGQITELCGLPGTGKTQLCLYLSLLVQFPIKMGGVTGESVYLDTSANFSIPRLKEMHCNLKQKFKCKYNSFDVSSALKKIHHIEAIGTVQFCAALQLLPDFINKNKNIRLIVIDSIGYPFKDGCPELNRTGILYRALKDLRMLAKEHNIAIIISNEVSTRIGIGAVPSLGDTYSHMTGRRLLLSDGAVALTHSNSHPYTQISWNGVEDL